MSFFDTLKSFFVTTEKDVFDLIVLIEQDGEVLINEIEAALTWIANNTPAIAADIQRVLSIVQVVGITNPTVEAAVVAANEAVSALNAFAAASKSGAGTAESVVAGYTALKQAQAAVAAATAHAVSSN